MRKKFWTPRVKLFLAIAAIAAILTTLTAAVTAGSTAGQDVVGTLLSPLRGGIAAFDRRAERIYNYLFRYESLEAENAVLQAQVQSIRKDALTAEAYRRENERLRELLELSKEHEDYAFLSAYVIAWNTTNWENTVTIGKGKNNGLAAGMCATTEAGQVVGLVGDVGANWATIITIYDLSSGISASVSSSGTSGVVQGVCTNEGKNQLRMNYLPTEAVIKNGDQVVTAGSTSYPRGLILGTVCESGLDETGVAKYAILEPTADLSKVEQLFLIIDYENT